MSKILQMPNLFDSDFLACALWPNNPSLHPPILIGLFEVTASLSTCPTRTARDKKELTQLIFFAFLQHWDGKTPFDPASLPVFIYKDLRTESARYLVELDRELVALVAALAKAHPENAHLALNYSLKVCCCSPFII